VFEAILRGRARASRDQLSDAQKEDLDATIARIESDPWLDGRTKCEFPVPPLILWMYRDGVWRIAYRVVDDAFIEIFQIQRML
jgi:hypothetical protein